MNTLITV